MLLLLYVYSANIIFYFSSYPRLSISFFICDENITPCVATPRVIDFIDLYIVGLCVYIK